MLSFRPLLFTQIFIVVIGNDDVISWIKGRNDTAADDDDDAAYGSPNGNEQFLVKSNEKDNGSIDDGDEHRRQKYCSHLVVAFGQTKLYWVWGQKSEVC